ncbi:unnamed protein product [Fraxinus pennsylvanica]|uniref:Ubiquitin-like domain-containing protein n=1 Tax=Fraxinus pennsylvanica TaxID=56036 RepID=A0AAD1Z6J7_9LAMI|nr:unnamed protein product [Fraxinus pennsylvanica]
MMRMKTKSNGAPPTNGCGSNVAWKLRPGGCWYRSVLTLTKTRRHHQQFRFGSNTDRFTIKFISVLKLPFTFGELKKMLAEPMGLHYHGQKLFYKDKERDSNAFLDTIGVKNKSKLVLMEDPIISQEKRYIEMRKKAKMGKTTKFISKISLEVDRFGGQVIPEACLILESTVNKNSAYFSSSMELMLILNLKILVLTNFDV